MQHPGVCAHLIQHSYKYGKGLPLPRKPVNDRLQFLAGLGSTCDPLRIRKTPWWSLTGYSTRNVLEVSACRKHAHLPWAESSTPRLCRLPISGRVRTLNMINAKQTDSQLPVTVLSLNEACFTREGMVNAHSMHVWSSENPHNTALLKVQHKFCINT